MRGAVAVGCGVELFVRAGSQCLARDEGECVHEAGVRVCDLRTDRVVHAVIDHALGGLNGNGHGQGSDRRRIGQHERLVIVPAGEAVRNRGRDSTASRAASAGGRTR